MKKNSEIGVELRSTVPLGSLGSLGSLVVTLLLGIACGGALPSLAQNAPPYNLPHVSTRLSTDAFIFQPLGSTKVDYQTRAELFSGYALSPTYPVFNVRSAPYSATGDGVTDDTAAVVAALEDACVAGVGYGPIRFPAGTYLVTPPLQVKCPGVSILGDGKDLTYIKFASNGDGLWFGNATVLGGAYGEIRDLTLTGGASRTGYALKFDGGDGGRITNINIRGGGSGIGFCTDGILGGDGLQHCNLMEISDVDIVTSGASSVGVRIDGGNDRTFNSLSIRGTDTARTGKIGLLITQSLGGDIFKGMSGVVTQDIGVKIAPTSPHVVVWETFLSFYSDTNKTKGWELSGTGSISGINFVDAWAGTNGNTWGSDAGAGASSYGFDLETGSALRFIGLRAFNTGGLGFYAASGITHLGIEGGLVSGNSQASSGTLPGVRIAASGWTLSGVRSGQSMLTSGNTQSYGLEIVTGADNYNVTGNDFRTNATGGMLNTPGLATTRIVTANAGVSAWGSYAPYDSKYIARGTADSSLTAAQFLGSLGTGILKNTTTTGDLSIAVAGDFPTLNQSTTGSAATLTTPRTIAGVSFDGSANIAIPHSGLTGLTSGDDHTQYTLLAGRSGGQTVKGDTASGGNLTLMSTAHATKGKLLFGISAYDEANNRLGLLTTSPDVALTVDTNTVAPTASGLTGTTGFHLIGPDSTNPRALVDSVSATGAIDFRRSEGTYASPAAVASGAAIGQITASGHNGSAYTTTARAAIQFTADQLWTTSANGTRIDFSVTANGATSATNAMRLDNAGHLGFPNPIVAPTVACTGTGTSPTAPSMDTGSTDNDFTIIMNTGTGSPGSSGTCTVTFGTAYTGNMPVLVCTLQNGANAWGVGSGVVVTTKSLSAPILTWWNESAGALTALATSGSWQINCIALRRG